MGAVAGQIRDSRRAVADTFRNDGLRRINLALAGSVIGTWAYQLAVAVWVYQEGGATALGIFSVVRYLLMALLAPIMGALADRHDKRLVMIASDLARAVVVIAVAVLIAADGPVLAVYALALTKSTISLAFRPAQAAILPSLAHTPHQLTSANAVASTIESVGFCVGPALAGLLLAVAGVAMVCVLTALTLLWSAALLVALPRSVPHPADAADEADTEPGLIRGAGAGFAAVGRDRRLRLIAGLYAAQTIVAGASVVYEVSIALDLLDLGESGIGLLGAVLGIGGLLGGFVALVLGARQRLATDFGLGIVLWSAPLLLIAVWPTIGSTLVAMFMIGIANSVVDVNALTIIQRLAPADVLSRVFGALESITIAGMAFGSLLMSVLIGTVGLRTGLAVLGAGVAALAIAGLTSLRRIDGEVGEPPGLMLLQQVPTLAVLPAPVLEQLVTALVPRTVPADTTVIAEGDEGDVFWVIERGRAAVSIGGEHVRDLGPGDSFGELALLRDVPRTATVRAIDELRLQGLERTVFIPAVTGHGESKQVADALVDRWLVSM